MPRPQKYKAATGTRWRVQYTDPSGKRRTKTGFPTQAEANHWIAETLIAKNTGSWIDPKLGQRRIDEIGEAYLKTLTHLKASTAALTDSTWRIHVLPRWGDVRLSEVRHNDVQAWASAIEGSPSKISRAVNLLRQIMEYAVNAKMIPANPASKIVIPRRDSAKRVYLTGDQLKALSEASAHPDIVLALGTVGLRWGELAGLQVKNVNAAKLRIRVERAAVRVKGKMVISTPKTHESRSVAVSAPVMALIVKACGTKRGEDLVWSQKDGTPLKPPGYGKWLDTAVTRCQRDDPDFPRVTAHGLRHVAAGLLVHSGASPKTVQRQLGHKSAAMTLDVYADLFDGELDQVADVMGSILT